MTTAANQSGTAASESLQRWIALYQQVPLGDDSWVYASFAELVARHGQAYEPASWPTPDTQHPGRCFHMARRRAEEAGWTYVEGFVLVPSAIPFSGFEHAWCLTHEGRVADPALPDGWATAYFGVPLSDRFCREQWALRGADSVLTFDPAEPWEGANTAILRQGLPSYAVRLTGRAG
ncbi:hypothetical protein [Streptomyces sp. NPDC002746]